jgi:PGF-pre-PGF domain-containing protein
MQRFAPLSNMGDFDFETTWNVTSSYPRLDWEGVPSLTVDSVSAAGTTVDEDATGTITVTASEGGTNAGEGVTIEVTNDDGLDGFATGDTKVTDTNGQVTFSFAESVDGSYTPAFAWQPDPSVSDTASVLVRDAPEVSSITRASPSNPTSASSVEFDVTFTESVSGVDTDDVVLTRINGDVAGSVATVSSSSGTTITVTVDSVVGDGDLRLDVDDDDGIVNGDGVPLGGSGTSGTADGSYTGNEVSTVDNTDPTIRTIATRDDGPAPGTTVDGTDGSAATANDGRIDQLLVTFSEPIDDSTVSSGDFAVTGYTIDAITDDGTANDDTLVFDLQESGSLDTGATPDVDYTEGALEDEAGNRLASATETPDDGVGPRIGSAETGDVNRDGTVDRVNVTFSEPIDDATLAAADFSVHGGWVDAVDNPDGTDDAFVNLSVSGLVTGDTSLTPELTLAQASVDDGDGNGGPAGADQINTPADGAPPVVVAATTDDANGDGDADRVVVTHSEALDDAASTLTTATYTIGSGTVDAVDTGATTDDDATAITVSGLTGTGVTPDVTLGSGTALDAAGNALGADRTFTGTTSGAAPIVTAATTLDRDGDGDVDAARVTFSTDMDDATITPSDWAIGGTAASTFVTGATAADDTGQLRITTDADEVSGTDPKEVTYTPGMARDTNGNALRSTAAGDVIEDDGATPVVTEFTATVQDNERIVVTVESSEQLDSVRVGVTGPETATLSSFSTSGIGPVTNNLTYESGAAGEYMLVLDEAADAAGNDGAGDETDTARIESGRSGGGPPSPAGSVTDRSGSARTLVFDDDGSATLPVSGDAVSEVTIRTTASATGYAQATELSRLPAGTASPSNRLLRTVDIQVPDEWGNTEATVELSVRRSQLDAESDRLRIEHYDESAGSWTTLETAVVRETDTTVTVGAETFGFSLFAVTAVDRPENDGAAAPEATAEAGTAPPTTQQDADAATPESTEAPDGEATGTPAGTSSPAPTEGTAPGFGPAVAVLSLVVGCLVARGAGN